MEASILTTGRFVLFSTYCIPENQTSICTIESKKDKAIIWLFADSGLRLCELAIIKASDIDLNNRLIKVKCKGNTEEMAVFDARTEQLLKQWLAQYYPNSNSIWAIKKKGIDDMLKQLRD